MLLHLTRDQLEAGLEPIRRAPADRGPIELIVCRPDHGEREELAEATLDPAVGLVGDNWLARGNRHTPDGKAKLACQLTVMSSRAIALFAGDRSRWSLAGDQIYVDLDLSEASLPTGTRLQVGTAMIEVSEQPHTGCVKFVERFGQDAARLVNTPAGRELRLRGLNAVIVEGGSVRVGDVVRRQ